MAGGSVSILPTRWWEWTTRSCALSHRLNRSVTENANVLPPTPSGGAG